ncbi:MAG: cation:proton antiporter [Dehalococcoidia bacterium]|nr:cation:proton antiporter [Dehalococcoidia bacterium]
MLNFDLLITLSVLLAAALVGGMLAHRLRQPIILGYLIIGILVGPHALKLITDIRLIQSAASIGVALLMFTVGLEISFNQLRDVGKVGIWGGIAQIAGTLILGTLAGLAVFGWPVEQSILFGLVISLSSTAVCLKILMDRGELSTVPGRIMVSFLILQDISVVLMTIILPLMGGSVGNIWVLLGVAIGKAVLFIGAAILLGRWLLPWIFGDVGGVRSRELFLLTIIVLCMGAIIGTELLGLSMVFGAFLIGMVLRSTKFVHQALAEITPLRDIFATLFFVSIGMLLNPAFILSNWADVLVLIAVIIAIKVAVVIVIVRSFKFNNRIAVLTAAGLFQLGEFSFVLAQGGINEGIVSEQFYLLILSSTVITMLLTPFIIALVSRIYSRIAVAATERADFAQYVCGDNQADTGGPGRVIVAGYGRVGANLVRGLDDAGIPYLIIDIDPGCIDEAKRCGSPRLYGDATNAHVLSQADLCNASVMVITFPGPLAVETTVKNALRINPKLKILARYHNEREARMLKILGVTELISPEYEAGFKFLKQILKMSGVAKDERQVIVDGVRK